MQIQSTQHRVLSILCAVGNGSHEPVVPLDQTQNQNTSRPPAFSSLSNRYARHPGQSKTPRGPPTENHAAFLRSRSNRRPACPVSHRNRRP